FDRVAVGAETSAALRAIQGDAHARRKIDRVERVLVGTWQRAGGEGAVERRLDLRIGDVARRNVGERERAGIVAAADELAGAGAARVRARLRGDVGVVLVEPVHEARVGDA